MYTYFHIDITLFRNRVMTITKLQSGCSTKFLETYDFINLVYIERNKYTMILEEINKYYRVLNNVINFFKKTA